MNDYRVYCNRRPEAAKVRADMAALYRGLRRDRPEMARLLYRRERDAVKRLTAELISGYSGGVAAALLGS